MAISLRFEDVQNALHFLQTHPEENFTTDESEAPLPPDSRVIIYTKTQDQENLNPADLAEYYRLLQFKKNVVGIFIDNWQAHDIQALRQYLRNSKISFLGVVPNNLRPNDVSELSALLGTSNINSLMIAANLAFRTNGCLVRLLEEHSSITKLHILEYDKLQIDGLSSLLSAIARNPQFQKLTLQGFRISQEIFQTCRTLMTRHGRLEVAFEVDLPETIPQNEYDNLQALALAKRGLNNNIIIALRNSVLRLYLEKTGDHTLNKKQKMPQDKRLILQQQIRQTLGPAVLDFCQDLLLKNSDLWFEEQGIENGVDARKVLLEKARQMLLQLLGNCVMQSVLDWRSPGNLGSYVVMHHFALSNTMLDSDLTRRIREFLRPIPKALSDVPPCIDQEADGYWLDNFLEKSASLVGFNEYVAAKMRHSLEMQKTDLCWVQELYYQKCAETFRASLQDQTQEKVVPNCSR